MSSKAERRRSVLIVEDEPEVRELLAEYFRGRAYEVTGAGDGRAAIAALERATDAFDLVLTDLILPGADGLAVLEAARRVNAETYVVIVTGFASLDSAMQAVRLGAYDYLTKPFSLEQIDVVLRRIDDRTGLAAENRRLVRQIAQQDGVDLRHAFLLRLESIENRLARIEAALRPRG
jgi:two-component system, NtrC family, response regulator PilR